MSNQERLQENNENLQALVEKASFLGGGSRYSKTVLWKNESPTSKFSSQTIALPLDDYDAVEIIYSMSTFAAMNRFSTTGEMPVSSDYLTIATLNLDANHPAEVWVRKSANEIKFTMDDRETNVPYLIYGIKR